MFVAGCNGSSEPTASPTAVASPQPTTTAAAEAPKPATSDTPEATEQVPEPTPVTLSDEEQVEAALLAFEIDPPEEFFAYDVVEAAPQGTTGVIAVKICAWDGDTVFDQLYQASYRVNANETGEPTVILDTFNTIPGDCTNTTLIESVFEFTREYETFWSGVITEPDSFSAEEASQYWTPELQELNNAFVAELQQNGTSFRGLAIDGNLPDSAIVDILMRSFTQSNLDVLEVLACRDMPEEHGLYRGDELVDSFRPRPDSAAEAIAVYTLTRSPQGWQLFSAESRIWANCRGFGDRWLDVINDEFGGPVDWQALSQ